MGCGDGGGGNEDWGDTLGVDADTLQGTRDCTQKQLSSSTKCFLHVEFINSFMQAKYISFPQAGH